MKKIMSGGQTGADRGALEAAKSVGFPYGGWVPKGRRAEDGQVPAKFDKLEEHFNPGYNPRTQCNVRDSDGTLIVSPQPMTPGSQLTLRFCRELQKPVIVRDAKKVIADPGKAAVELMTWLKSEAGRRGGVPIAVLNVAGTRESKCPGLQAAVGRMMEIVMLELGGAYGDLAEDEIVPGDEGAYGDTYGVETDGGAREGF